MKKIFLTLSLLLLPSLCLAGTVTLQWGASQNATEYRVYQMEPGGNPAIKRTPIQTLTGLTASVTVEPGAYSWYVTAANAWGESAPSNVVTTPGLATTPVLQLTGFTLNVTGSIQVQ